MIKLINLFLIQYLMMIRGAGGGGGVLHLGILGGGVPPGSSTLDLISDPKM